MLTLLLLFSVWHWSLLSALLPAAAPITITLLYILAFRQGRPPGYDTDLFEQWLKGPGFGPAEPIPTLLIPNNPSDHV